MKAKAVSVSRDKRGLPAVMRPALPQVVELASQTTQKRKTDTMKKYILHPSQTVEPQTPTTDCAGAGRVEPSVCATGVGANNSQSPPQDGPPAPTSLADISSRGSQPCAAGSGAAPALFIGM